MKFGIKVHKFKMGYFNWRAFHFLFKVLCIIASIFMVIYWIIEYQKNEDTTAVEVLEIQTMEDAILPEITIFVVNPFMEEKLKKTSAGLNGKLYLQYLAGHIDRNESYRNINYEDVTLDLFEHLHSYTITWKPSRSRKKTSSTTCTSTQKCPYVFFKNNLNAFMFGTYTLKGFGIELNTSTAQSVKDIQITFKPSLRALISTFIAVNVMINYPQQILHKNLPGGRRIWSDANETTEFIGVVVNALEIQKKRNTKHKPCQVDWMRFDELVLEEHIEKVGCRAPYQKPYKGYPLCDTKYKMSESIFEFTEAGKDGLVPCQELSQYSFILNKFNASEDPTLDPSALTLFIQYPDDMKVITQS